jgi:hypothetical protein
MQRLSGYFRQHLSRLIARYRDTHSIEPATRSSHASFSRRYQAADVLLLAQTDSWHDTLSGPATQVLLRRASSTFGDLRYERLSQISVSHIYNLRASPPYLKHGVVWRGTRPSAVPIGIRKPPLRRVARLYPHRYRAAPGRPRPREGGSYLQSVPCFRSQSSRTPCKSAG